MSGLQAIETRYMGYRFRSRLEARWAVFFDALGVPWEYEPEGFQTSAGWYLPDFRVRAPDGFCCYVEVRPTNEPEPRVRALNEAFCAAGEYAHCQFVYGDPLAWLESALARHGGVITGSYLETCWSVFADARAAALAARQARFEHGGIPASATAA